VVVPQVLEAVGRKDLRTAAPVLGRSAGADSARGSATSGFRPTAVRSLPQLHEALRKLLPALPPQTLEKMSKVSLQYFFWSGAGKLESCSKHWQARLSSLFKLASIQNGHAHRLRDTFAVELLLAGVPLERLSILLGHQSVRITEKHYAPWAQERQDQLEADLRKAWKKDPYANRRGDRLGTVRITHR
jgi:integrase